jgi:hypothetical protein
MIKRTINTGYNNLTSTREQLEVEVTEHIQEGAHIYSKGDLVTFNRVKTVWSVIECIDQQLDIHGRYISRNKYRIARDGIYMLVEEYELTIKTK